MQGEPIHVTPRLVERIWGRTDLGGWVGGAVASDGRPIGEAWLTDLGCEVEGRATLGDLLDRDRTKVLGGTAQSAPLLAKLLFTAAPLSVQVHPTDTAADAGGVLPSGKNEMWHVLEAAPDAIVWVGFATPVSAAVLRAAVADGSVPSLLCRRAVVAGDSVWVPAGTVHAIGAGLILLEIQDPVDVTYRLYDYGRPRPLQIEEALAVADLAPLAVDAPSLGTRKPSRRLLTTAPRFVVELCEVGSGIALRPDGDRYHILIPLAAGVTLDGRKLARGAAVIVPAEGRMVTLAAEPLAAVAIVHSGPGPSPCLAAG